MIFTFYNFCTFCLCYIINKCIHNLYYLIVTCKGSFPLSIAKVRIFLVTTK
nr:MAG TPA: hypothetical protein [Microviridae sp.]